MKYGRMCAVLFLLSCLVIGLGCVSAAEYNATQDVHDVSDTVSYTQFDKSAENNVGFMQDDDSVSSIGSAEVHKRTADRSNNQKAESARKVLKQTGSVNVNNYDELADSIDNAASDSLIINLNNGTYTSTGRITLSNQTCKNITINGNKQVIDGNRNQFLNIGRGFFVLLNNVTVSNCYGDNGGVIYNNGTVILNNSAVMNNTASNGAVIYNCMNASFVLNNSVFSSNTAADDDGYVIYMMGNAAVCNSQFYNNTDLKRDMLFSNSTGSVRISNNTYHGNYLEVYASSISDNITLTDDDYINTVKLSLRDIYNSTVDNGAVTVTVSGAEYGRFNVADGTVTVNMPMSTFRKLEESVGYVYDSADKSYQSVLFDTVTVNAINITLLKDMQNAVNKAKTNIVVIKMDLFYYDSITVTLNNQRCKNIIIEGSGSFIQGKDSRHSPDHEYQCVFDIQKAGFNVTIQNLDIYNVFFRNINDGAIHNNGSNLIVKNCKFYYCAPAIYNTGNLSVKNCLFENSLDTDIKEKEGRTYSNYTGVLYNNGNAAIDDSVIRRSTGKTEAGSAVVNEGNLRINNTNITDNSNSGINCRAGGIYNHNGQLIMNNILMSGNSGDVNGGAIANYNGTVEIKNMTITGSRAKYGAAIFNSGGNISILKTVINNNIAEVTGGAVTNYGGLITVTETNFTNNHAANGTVYNYRGKIIIHKTVLSNNTSENGAAVYNQAALNSSETSLTISSSEIKSNTAGNKGVIHAENGLVNITNTSIQFNTAAEGGVFYFNHGKEIRITGTTAANNNATQGGVIYINNSTVTLEDMILNSNTANEGGAINNNRGTLIITSTILNSNTAADKGGSIKNYGNTTLNNVTIRDNTAESGGAVYTHSGIFIINNSKIEENRAYNKGGAIYQNTGTVTVNSTSLNNNTADDSDIIYSVNGNININNSPLSDNTFTGSGGIITVSDSNLILENTKIAGNKLNSKTLILNNGNTTIKNSDITGNTAGNMGIITNNGKLEIQETNMTENTVKNRMIDNNQNMIIINTNIKNNNAENGIIYNNADTIITGSSITGNRAANGGAIYNNGTVKINSTDISDNTAQNSGGAVYNNRNINITNSTLKNNTANNGGAIYSTDGNINITDSTLKNNTAINNAGAVYIINTNLLITYSNITGNNASNEAVLRNNGKSTIKNSNITNNTAGSVGIISNNRQLEIHNTSITHNTAKDEIIANTANASIINTAISFNNVKNYGTIYNRGNITINNTSITYNTASNSGGAVYNYGNTTITSCSITDNRANNGGAVYNEKHTTILINTSITSNNAVMGGAIYNNANTIITDTNITHNTASTGGAIYNNANITITDTNLTSNKALIGGAIYNKANTTITKSRLTNNNARWSAGAIYTESNMNITDTNITHNTAKDNGGAIYNYGNTTITSSSITDNRANNGGAIYNDANLKIKNSAINNNKINQTNGYIINMNANTTIISTQFNNNTDFTEDILFTNTTNNITIKNNTYTGNYLETHTDTKLENKTLTQDTYNTTITIKIKDIYNSTVQNGIITVLINNNTYNNFQITKGTAHITIPGNIFTQTKNSITYKYTSPDKSYQPLTLANTITVKIEKHNTTITINPVNNTEFDNKINITGTLTDNSKTPIKNAQIQVNNKTLTTNQNGIFTTTITIKPGTNIITASYNGNEQYNPSKTNTTVKGLKHETTAAIDPVTGLLGKNVTFKAHITDNNGTKVNEGYVIFKVNNVTLKDNKGKTILVSIKNGTATLTTTATWNNAVNTTVCYSGSSKYKPSRTENGTIKLARQNATINMTIQNNGLKPGQTLHVTVKITDMDQKPVTTGNILFKMNGKTMKHANGTQVRIEVTNETATLNYIIPINYSAKTYRLTAVYTGTYYNRIKETQNLTLTPRDATINMTIQDNKNLKPGSNLKATATITDTQGFLVTNGQVTFKLNDKTLRYNNGTPIKIKVTNGTATLNYTIPSTYTAKTYKLTAEYDASNYNTVTTSKNITLNKINTYIQPVNITLTQNTLTVKANIINNDTGKIAKERTNTVSVKLDKHTVIKEEKIQKGRINLITNITANPGTHTIEIVTSGNGIYNPCRQTFNITDISDSMINI